MKSDIEVTGGAVPHTEPRRIPLRDKSEVVEYALVDADDYERFAGYNWNLKPQVKGPGYAVRGESRPEQRRGAPQRIYLHREVMGLPRGDKRHVDHISRDTLDDRKSNLRICTHAQNRQNTSGWTRSTSKHRGVSWSESRKRWVAQAMLNGKNHLIGRFKDEEEAADAVAAWRAAHMPFSTD